MPQPRSRTPASSSWPSRPARHQLAKLVRGPLQLALVRPRVPHPQPPLALGCPDRHRERPEVALRDDVDGPSHERRLDDASPLERPRQVLSPEALETGPEPHVSVRRVLILNSPDALERARNRKPAREDVERAAVGRAENGPVQLALGENALGHGSTILPPCSRPSWRSSRCPPSSSARRGRTPR